MNSLLRTIILVLLKWEARLVLLRHKPFVVAITGSVGKTSAKEAIAVLLGEHFFIRKSPKSFNSDIGVPLAILGLENAWRSPQMWVRNLTQGLGRVFSRSLYPEVLVLEMGVDRPGDLDRLLSWVRPNAAVVTAIGKMPVHVEFFAGPEEVAAEKSKLVSAVSEDGIVILNADDKAVLNMRNLTSARVITYGFSKDADVRASQYRMLISNGKPHGISFKIDALGKTMPMKVEGVLGEHAVFAFLAAAAIGIARDLNLIEISEGLAKYTLLRLRLPPRSKCLPQFPRCVKLPFWATCLSLANLRRKRIERWGLRQRALPTCSLLSACAQSLWRLRVQKSFFGFPTRVRRLIFCFIS